jgi:acyl-CoA hydrolase
MHWIDIAAALAAMRHSGKVCVTASVDVINFFEPIKLGHVVRVLASVNRAFSTSMEIGVKVFREDPLHGVQVHTSSAYLTFVAIDQYGKPLQVPPIIPCNNEDSRRFEEAGIRREQRLKNRELLKEARKKTSE